MTSLAIVTATTNLERALPCITSWLQKADNPPTIYLVLNGARPADAYDSKGYKGVYTSHEYLGSVPAFRQGVDMALKDDCSIIACLHDDFEILESGWDQKVVKYFDRYPAIGLLGFGGAVGLGQVGMYDRPYDPMSLARSEFRSDLVDAETHGIRSLLAEQVACLDGFSQIGYRGFWEGHHAGVDSPKDRRPWTLLEELGFRHHFYDGALGLLAARYGWETWYVPLRAKHWGGRTAVGDPGYQAWAKTQDPKGDQGFWEAAHKIGWQEFHDILPLRI